MNQAESSKLKLMVVDDEPDNLDLLYRTFRREFKVYKADGALTALDILDEEGEMALIISDQRMPVMNGTEFLSKTVERFPETIRILLTGYTDVEDLVDAINTGQVFKYITKPWSPEELKATVRQASELYLLLKQRTFELRRALRREELFNSITRAIRESLDYKSTLQTIVDAISKNFDADWGILRAVEGKELVLEPFCYHKPLEPKNLEIIKDSLPQMEEVFTTLNTKVATQGFDEAQQSQIVVPLLYKQELQALISLFSGSKESQYWQESDLQLLEAVGEQAALAISQAKLYQRTQQQTEKMQAELNVARQIQTNLLRQSPPELEGVRIEAICHAAREVGGDFFEVYHHPQGDTWLAVGDVSGKGVPAALFMASAISILRRELSQEKSPEPEEVVKNVNQTMSEDLFSTNCFITLLIARYTPDTGRMVYTNAGHIYPMVWSHRQLSQGKPIQVNYLKARGIPVGILPTWRGVSGELTLNPGDVFLLTSDGITEASVTKPLPNGRKNTNEWEINSTMLNQEGLWQLICQEPDPFNLKHLLTTVREYTSEVQEDDQTMLHLEIL